MMFEKYILHQYDFTRQTMRQVKRFLLEAKSWQANLRSIADIINPNNFDVTTCAVQNLCVSSRNEINSKEYGIPSLAPKLGHSFCKCTHILKGICLRKDNLKGDEELKPFINLLNMEWH